MLKLNQAVLSLFLAGFSESLLLDFENLTPGDFVSYLGNGVTVATSHTTGCTPEAMVFDSSNPVEDPDLGSPNQNCPGCHDPRSR